MWNQIKASAIWDFIKWAIGSFILGFGSWKPMLAYSHPLAVALSLISLYILGSVIFGNLSKRFFKPNLDIDSIKKSAVLEFILSEAEQLKIDLEEVQDRYENDPNNTEKLIYPCGNNVVPEEIKENRHKELFKFRASYLRHWWNIKKIAPNLTTQFVEASFPHNDPITSRRVLRMIDEHAKTLSSYIESLNKQS